MTREEILLIAKPILFNTDMVRAILDDRKSATRRVANISADSSCKSEDDFTHEFIKDDFAGHKYTGFVCRKCGFGVCPPHSKYPCGTSWIRSRYNVGDYLYVRETWSTQQSNACMGNTTTGCPYDSCETAPGPCFEKIYIYKATDRLDSSVSKWHPSIHMPKEAARIFLRVKDVRVERLQEMDTPDDEHFLAEGAKDKHDFIRVWDSTVKPAEREKYGWYANPWVWVIEFERVIPD